MAFWIFTVGWGAFCPGLSQDSKGSADLRPEVVEAEKNLKLEIQRLRRQARELYQEDDYSAAATAYAECLELAEAAQPHVSDPASLNGLLRECHRRIRRETALREGTLTVEDLKRAPLALAVTPAARQPYLKGGEMGNDRKVPDLECPSIDYRGWKTWEEVGQAMQAAAICPTRQTWKTTPDPAFAPARVALAHWQGKLIVYAELTDAEIYNDSQTGGGQIFTTGDVLETFLRAETDKNYLEHHVSPDNVFTQLEFADGNVIKNFGKIAEPYKTLVGDVPVRSAVWVQSDLWRVLLVIPLMEVTVAPELSPVWRFSFSRYDFTKGKKGAVLSSTSGHDEANFHQQSGWGRLRLVP